ncbi:hypothetical protein WR25_11681 [Diploscapter pachys]|uniref:Uncharacterized protein n=1 Tax=Diploscapter pachys TaxID=2018661 RepID=A0A2A2KP74_9BILA|nr:hypothetical protein WR25_11681 [Diploscapter pachys]
MQKFSFRKYNAEAVFRGSEYIWHNYTINSTNGPQVHISVLLSNASVEKHYLIRDHMNQSSDVVLKKDNTTWNNIIPMKLTFFQLVKKFDPSDGVILAIACTRIFRYTKRYNRTPSASVALMTTFVNEVSVGLSQEKIDDSLLKLVPKRLKMMAMEELRVLDEP